MHLRFRNALTTLFLGKKSQLDCVACGRPVSLKDFRGDRHLRCAECGANLVLVLGHNWLYTTICLTGGFATAYLQGLHGPAFLAYALMYSAALVIVAAPIPAPFFPPKLTLDPDSIQTLRIPPK